MKTRMATSHPTQPTLRQAPVWPWIALPARLVLFMVWQAIFALAFLLSGSPDAWNASAAWWPFTVTFSNLVCLILLPHLYSLRGESFWAVFRIQREHAKRDLWIVLAILIVSVPISMLPNILGGNWLFGNVQAALDLFVRPLPVWAAVAGSILFAVTQGATELAVYFAYIMPRLTRQTGSQWLGLGLPALFLALQHVAVPLLFDWRFVIWRLVMFAPFALLLGWALQRRPRLLPYLMILHGLMDLSLAPLIIMASQ